MKTKMRLLIWLLLAPMCLGETKIDPFVPPTEISEELLYKKYDTNFPVPVVENVYLAWKPVDAGNPLKEEETLFYAPPQFERVKFIHDGPQSRSIDDEVFHRPKGPIVIPAEPKKEPASVGYSVYGSPDINYSELYSKPEPPRLPTDDVPRPDGRENPYLAFQRDYLSSALNSRSADTRDYPLLWGDHGKQEESALEPVDPNVGGLQMIKPPNRQRKKPTEYFYYSEDSPHYKEKLSKKPNKEEFEADNEIVSIDGIVVGPKHSLTTAKPDYPEDLEYDASERLPNYLRPRGKTAAANAVVYSFKNNYGQQEHVGVIFDEQDDLGPQVSKVLPSNKQDVLGGNNDADRRHDGAHFRQPSISHQQHQRPNANFIPLEKRPENPNKQREQQQAFPLGNPFLSPLLKARPEFFPPINYPPLYKIQPKKLEGKFGPAFPPKRAPDVITFPDEELPGVQREEIRRPEYFAPRNPERRDNNNQPPSNGYVYKTVRDMDYVRPQAILQVRPSGELFMPEPEVREARVPILPGVKTMEDYDKLKEEFYATQTPETPADDRIWKPDFSDVLETEEADDGYQPFDLEADHSVRDEVIFKDDTSRKPGSSFKFPGASSSSSNESKRPLREITKKVTTQKVKPNYSVVIGLTYDDDGPDQESRDYDEDFFTTTEEPAEDKPAYGKDDLYEICIKEVPRHLHRELCGYIRDGTIAPGLEPTKELQPRPSKLIQGPPVLSGQFVKPEVTQYKHDPFAGIPTELPVQISKDDKQPISLNVKAYKAEPLLTEAPTTTSTTTVPPSTPAFSRNRARPLVYNKYDVATGEAQPSKPYEYFNRLTTYFNNRVRPNQQQHHHHHQPHQHHPRLQRHRIRPGST